MLRFVRLIEWVDFDWLQSGAGCFLERQQIIFILRFFVGKLNVSFARFQSGRLRVFLYWLYRRNDSG